MGCRKLILIAGCFGSAWLVAQAGSAPKQLMKTFRDARLGIEYRYPAYLEDPHTAAGTLNSARSNTADPEAKQRMSCLTMPLDARHRTATDHEIIEILVVDFACMGKVVDVDSMETVVLGNFASSLKAYGGAPQVGTPHRYKLNGYPADFLSATVAAPTLNKDATLYDASSCVLIGQTVVCWSFMSTDKGKLKAFLRNPVSFAGHEDVALVPAEFLSANPL